MNSARCRDLFLHILEETRLKYRFVVHGYVVMPEHFHLLITKPEVKDPSVVMKVLKERFSRQVSHERRQAHAAQGRLWKDVAAPVWQKRFYDFNVWTERKRVEKLRYMASQSRRTRTGGKPRTMEVEQFLQLSVWRKRFGASELSRVAIADRTPSRTEIRQFCRLKPPPTHSHRTRMNGAPGCNRAGSLTHSDRCQTDFAIK